jgi:argininosuccinate lyase
MKILSSSISSSGNDTLFQFTQGIDVDARLFLQEIRVQKAWAQALTDAGYLTSDDLDKIIACLTTASGLIASGTFEWRIHDEDIHMNLERYMTENIGDLGKKIHLGRSRNDLIATTLRLFVHDQCSEIENLLSNFKDAIKTKSSHWISVLVPGMTHLQFGQPIRLGHTFAAHGYAVKRDIARIKFNKQECLDVLPLGSAAFAGTHIAIHLEELASQLNFRSPPQNSYDSVGDRDFILSALNTLSLVGTHLSRYCEDVMYWSSTGIGVMNLPKDWSTGSSIMPNKRNPDVPELVRGRMSRVIVAANSGMTLVRSVVPSYGSDLHELKRTFLNACDEVVSCLKILIPFTLELTHNEERATALLNTGHILATDIANSLANTSTFREAYKILTEKVKIAEENHVQVHDLFKDTEHAMTFDASIEKRNQSGGTSFERCKASIEAL